MSDTAIAGIGTVFAIGDGTSAETFTPVAGIISINGIASINASPVDITTLDDTDGYMRHGVFQIDGGTPTLEMIWKVAEYNVFKDFIEGRAAKNIQVTFANPAASIVQAAALCTGVEVSSTTPSFVTMTVNLKISGAQQLTT